jgi:hypothetical protein
MAKSKMDILEMIDRGEISAEEGMRMIANLDQGPAGTLGKTREMDLLEKIERGELSTGEALRAFNGDGDQENEPQPEVIGSSPARTSTPEAEQQRKREFSKWQEWWMIPFAIGTVIIVLAGNWMNNTYNDAGMNFWFFCAWLPLLIGIALASLSFASRNAPWVHVRVNSSDAAVHVSLPLPIGITGWGLRNFGHYIPNLKSTQIDEVLLALDKTVSGETPLHVIVNDDEDGEHVEVFIG